MGDGCWLIAFITKKRRNNRTNDRTSTNIS
jgi:hypothetical protein